MSGDGARAGAQGEAAGRGAAMLRGIVLAALFALPFLALFVTPRLSFPYVTTKGFAFRAIVELAFAAWAWLAIVDARYRPRGSVLLACFGAMLAAMAAADALGVDPERSFFGNFLRMEGYATLLHLFAFFLVAATVLESETLWRRYFATSVGVSVLVSCFGLVQHFGYVAAPWGVLRIDATFGNPAYLAGYLLLHVFLAAFLLARAQRAWSRGALAAALALDIGVLWLTATRGAAVGLVAGAAAAALVLLWRGGARRAARRAAWLVLALVALGTAGIVAARHSPLAAESTMIERFAEIGPGDATGDVRLRIWSIAWQAFRERPILGWGQENFRAAFDRDFDPVLAHDAEWVDRAHNLVLDWLVAGGAVGGLAYLSLFAASLWLLWRRGGARLEESALLSGLIVGDFVNLLFLFDGVATYLIFASVLAYLHASAVREAKPRRAFAVAPAVRRAAGPAIALLLMYALWLDGRGLLACAALQKALVAGAAPEFVAAPAEGGIFVTPPPQSYDDLVAMRDWFRRAIAYRSFGTGEAREAFALVSYGFLSSGDDPWVRANFARLAVAEMAAQVRDHARVRDMLFLGSMEVLLGRYDEGIAMLDRAAALAPRRQTIAAMLALAYQREGETAKSLSLLQRAFDLDPTYDTMRIAYAAAAIASGDEERGRALLVERYGTDLVPDNRLIAAYEAIKRSDKVVALWRMRVASDPGNTDDRVRLAGALMRAGKGLDAVKELGRLNQAVTRPQGPAAAQ